LSNAILVRDSEETADEYKKPARKRDVKGKTEQDIRKAEIRIAALERAATKANIEFENTGSLEAMKLLRKYDGQIQDILEEYPTLADRVPAYSKRRSRALAAFLPEEKTAVYAPGVKGKELRALRMHEVGAHYSIGRMLGEEVYARLLKDLSGLRAGSKIVQEAYKSVPSDTPARLKDHEALGYLVENYERMPIVKRLFQMVKDWVAKTFGGEQLTATDLRMMVKAAMHKYGAEVREEFLTEGTVEERVSGQPAEFSKSLADSNELASNGKVIRTRVANAIDKWVENTPEWGKDTVKRLQGAFEGNVNKKTQSALLSLTGVMDLADLVRKYNPQIADEIVELHKASALRDRKLADRLKEVEDTLLNAKDTIRKHSENEVNKFNDLTNASTLDGVILDKPKSDEYLPENMPEYDPNHPLVKRFQKLPKDLQNLYSEFRRFYARYSLEFLKAMEQDEVLSDAGKLLTKLFSKSIVPYFPLYRKGDFWLAYIDPDTNSEAVEAFENPRDRRERMRELVRQGADQAEIKEFMRTDDLTVDSAPTREFRKVLELLQKKNADKDLINTVYNTYLDLFPNKSVMGQFKKRKGTPGYLKDPVQVFSDIGTRFAMNASQFETHKSIDAALDKVMGHATERPEDFISMVVNSVRKRAKYIKNPTPSTAFDKFAAEAGYVSYLWYIAGNISSALINLTQLPIVTYGLLSGKYGIKEAADAMSTATKMYFGGGWDNNTSLKVPGFDNVAMNDYTFGQNKNLPKEYQDLYREAVDRGAIRRSTGQDLRAQRGKPTTDPTSKWTRGLYLTGWLFQNTERFNREVTLLATYKLARKRLNHKGAMEEAIRTVESASGSSMAELGPQFFQAGPGRVIGTFKRFALSQIYLIYKLSSRALSKDVDPEIRKESAKQLLAIHTTAFLFAGLKGMPVYGLANVLASLLAKFIPDDEDKAPFDFDDFIVNNLGYSMFRGPLSALLNIDIGSRTGFGDLLWRPDERRMEELGPGLYILEQALGPIGGITKNAWKGYEQITQGDWMRGIETMSPSVVRNLLKGMRFATEGAVDSKGEKIVDDLNAWNIFSQILGATPNTLAEAYDVRNQVSKAVKADQDTRDSLYNRAYLARLHNDYDEIVAVNKDIEKYNSTGLGKVKPIKDLADSYTIRRKTAESSQSTGGISTGYRKPAEIEAFKRYLGID